MFKSKPTTTAAPAAADAFTIPPLADLAPRVAELQARLEPLGLESAKLLDEERALAGSAEDPEKIAAAERAKRLAEVLGGDAPEIPVTNAERLKQIRQRKQAIEAALAMINAEIATETRRASSVVRERVAPEYRRLIGDVAAALVSLHTKQTAIFGLRTKLEAAGYGGSDVGSHLPHWLDRTGPHSNIAVTLREFAAADLLAARDIPVELKP
jgi:hypothetical protein